MRRPIKYQLLKLQVPAAGDYPISAESDKAYKKITGIQFTNTDAPSMKGSYFKKFEIDGNEIYPDGYEVKMIQTGQEVPPDDRFYTLNERAEGSTINIQYTDGGNAAAYPYYTIIYLRLENPID